MPEGLVNYSPPAVFLEDKPFDQFMKNLLIVGYSLTQTSNPAKEYVLSVQILLLLLHIKKKRLFSSEVAESLQ